MKFLDNYIVIYYYRYSLFFEENIYGDCGEVVNTPACGAGIRGFDPHQSPHYLMGYGQVVKATDFDSVIEGSTPSSPAIICAGVAELADALDLGSSS